MVFIAIFFTIFTGVDDMCTPTLLAVSGLAAGVAGAGLQAVGAYRGAKAANKAAEYNESIAMQNAAIRDQQAADAERRGKIAEQEERQRTKRLMASQISSFAGAGVDVGSGSVLDVTADTEYLGERDALDIRSNYAREAYGLRSQGVDFRQQAALSKSQRRNPRLAATTSFLGSAAPLIGGFGSFQRNF